MKYLGNDNNDSRTIDPIGLEAVVGTAGGKSCDPPPAS